MTGVLGELHLDHHQAVLRGTHQQEGNCHEESADSHSSQSQEVESPPSRLLHQEELQGTEGGGELRMNGQKHVRGERQTAQHSQKQR